MNIDIEKVRSLCDPKRSQQIYVDDMIIEKDAILKLPNILNTKYGQYKNLVMVCDENTYKAAGQKVEALVPDIQTVCLDPVNLHNKVLMPWKRQWRSIKMPIS